MRHTPGAVLLLLATCLPAQAPAGFETAVDRLFRDCRRPGRPGAAVLVAVGEQVLLRKAYGLADLERSVALTPQSVFDIGSTSKQFTAACLLLLAQSGDLSLDDRVREHIDELPACFDPVTLRHLMLHTSGVPDYIDRLAERGADDEDRTTMDEALAVLCDVERLDFATGTRWAYSNSNYLLLSLVVEYESGLPLPQFARERIFEPLGMAHTHIHADCTALVPNRALSYSRSSGSWRWHFSNWEQTGDGAVFTTVGDLLIWARNFRHGRVGGQALLEAMAKRGRLDDGSAIDYGAGLVFGRIGERVTISHGGAWAAYGADLLRIPDRDLVVVCLCNRDDIDPTRLARRIAKLALKHLE